MKPPHANNQPHAVSATPGRKAASDSLLTQPLRHGAAVGFTLLELLTVLTIIGLLASMVMPGIARNRQMSKRIQCTNNLKQIGVAFRLFSTDHSDRYPMNAETNTSGPQRSGASNLVARYFQTMSNELNSPIILICPADNRRSVTTFRSLQDRNVSYFLGLDADETKPADLLAGDRNLTVNGIEAAPGILTLATNSVLGWSRALHNSAGNAALGDGSVQNLSPSRLRAQATTASTTNRLAIP